MHRKSKDSSTIALSIAVGAILLVSGFNIVIYESQITQKVYNASSCWTLRIKVDAKSRLASLKAKSNRPLELKLGWILYTFDNNQFLEFMQFLLDKVILFTLMICEE